MNQTLVSSGMTTTRPITETVLAGAEALAHAGQWQLGAELLATLGGDDPRFLLARAELEVWRDFWLGTRGAGEALAAAAASSDPAHVWAVELLTLVNDYFLAIAPPGGPVRIGPGQHDEATQAALAARAERLHATAPAGTRRGWAAFWRGAITDNVVADPASAEPCYQQALAAGEEGDDAALIGEALRHLGGHARRVGDHDRAGALWERSTRVRQGAGMVPGALSQQLALARHAVDTGNPDRAAAIAAEVHRWAGALGLTRLADQARSMLTGDPGTR